MAKTAPFEHVHVKRAARWFMRRVVAQRTREMRILHDPQVGNRQRQRGCAVAEEREHPRAVSQDGRQGRVPDARAAGHALERGEAAVRVIEPIVAVGRDADARVVDPEPATCGAVGIEVQQHSEVGWRRGGEVEAGRHAAGLRQAGARLVEVVARSQADRSDGCVAQHGRRSGLHEILQQPVHRPIAAGGDEAALPAMDRRGHLAPGAPHVAHRAQRERP